MVRKILFWLAFVVGCASLLIYVFTAIYTVFSIEAVKEEVDYITKRVMIVSLITCIASIIAGIFLYDDSVVGRHPIEI